MRLWLDSGPLTQLRRVLADTDAAYREADGPAFVGAMSSAYDRTGGGWKLALYQQTQILD